MSSGMPATLSQDQKLSPMPRCPTKEGFILLISKMYVAYD